jgi:hypothetical protein
MLVDERQLEMLMILEVSPGLLLEFAPFSKRPKNAVLTKNGPIVFVEKV